MENFLSMRILIVSSYLQGILLFRKQMIKFLLSEGYSIDVVAPVNDKLNADASISQQIKGLGVSVYDLDVSRKSFNIFDELKAIRLVFQKSSQIKYDYIFFLFPKSYYLLRLATLTTKAKKVTIIDGLGKYFTRYPKQPKLVSYKKFLMRMLLITLLTLNRFDNGRLFVLNNSDLEFLSKKLPRVKIQLLPFKGSMPIYGRKKTKKIKCIYVGRLTYEKGYLDLKRLKIELGEDLKIFGKYDESVNDPDRMVIDGWANDVPKVLNSAKFLLVTSYREGLSEIIQAAFTQNCVVVAYDVPGVSELVINGKTGFLVSPGDYESMLQVVKTTTQQEIDAINNHAMMFHKRHLNEIVNIKNLCSKLLF